MSIPVIMLIGYIIVLYTVSFVAAKRKNNSGSEGYFLGGRSFTPLLVAVMVTGIAIGGSSTIGVAENAYTQGLSAGWYNVAWALGAVFSGLFIIKKYRDLNVRTVTEIFDRYYGSQGRLISILGQLIIQMVVIALQIVAGGAIISALLPNILTPLQGMIISTIAFAGVALIGGIFAAGISNLINVIVIYLGVIIAVILCTKNVGGFEQIVLQLPEGTHWFSFVEGLGFVIIFANVLVMIANCIASQGVVQVGFAAKDSETAKRGFILAGILILPIGFISAALGVIAAATFPGISPTQALPAVILTLHPVVAGLVLTALWSADISTAVGMLLGGSSLVIEDFWKTYINPNLSSKQEGVLSRCVVLVLSFGTYLMATQVLGIVKTLTIGLSLLGSYSVVLVATLFFPQICRKSSAVCTITIGILVLLAWTFFPVTRIVPHVIYLIYPIALCTMALCALLDKRRITN